MYMKLLADMHASVPMCTAWQQLNAQLIDASTNQTFCRAMLWISVAYAVVRCPSVCLPVCHVRWCILSKGLNISSKFFRYQVATLF